MCCENHAYFRPGTTTSAYLTDDTALHNRLVRTAGSIHPAMVTTITFTVTWKPVRAPVTTEVPEVAEPVRV